MLLQKLIIEIKQNSIGKIKHYLNKTIPILVVPADLAWHYNELLLLLLLLLLLDKKIKIRCVLKVVIAGSKRLFALCT